jgi:hypothetical protein
MPRVNAKSKRASGKKGRQFFKQFVNGVLVHGQEFTLYLGHDMYGMGGYADLQMECLLRTLNDMDQRYEAQGKPLPRTLFLQLDSAKDNKNKYLFAFMEHLVNCKIFDKIEVAFLLVGHTHEDIDQRFSVLSRHLNLHDALTPSAWRNRVHEAYTGRREQRPLEAHEGTPVIKSVFSMHAYSAMLKPWIDPAYGGHDTPRLFQFYVCPVLGRCVQRYKHFSTSGEWFPHGRAGELGGDKAPAAAINVECPFTRDTVWPLRLLTLLPKERHLEVASCVEGFIKGTCYLVVIPTFTFIY